MFHMRNQLNTTHKHLWVSKEDKYQALLYELKKIPKSSKTIILVQDAASVEDIHEYLKQYGLASLEFDWLLSLDKKIRK